MIKKLTLLLFALSLSAHAQLWNGILNYVPSGSKGVSQTAVDWTLTGLDTTNRLPPTATWTASTTIAASTCSNGSSDCTSTIQSALNSATANHYVLLGCGTFLLSSASALNLTVNNTELRGSVDGSGNNCTLIHITSNIQDGTIRLGGGGDPSAAAAVSITGGATSGSTSITVSSATGFAVGEIALINELNDTTAVGADGRPYVTYGYTTSPGSSPNYGTPSDGANGCNYCDGLWNGTRDRNQMVIITGVSGTTLTFSPPLATDFTLTPIIMPITTTTHVGVRNLNFQEDGTHTNRNSPIGFNRCAYCWDIYNYEPVMDGDYAKAYWSFRGLLAFNVFDDNRNHGSGSDNAGITIHFGSGGFQILSNIFIRTENTLVNDNSSYNVYAYNFVTGNYAANPTYGGYFGGIYPHNTHYMMDLLEGNIDNQDWVNGGHGTGSQETAFRNWFQGTSYYCGSPNPSNTTPIACSSPSWTNESTLAIHVTGIGSYMNFVGDVVGSPALTALGGTKIAVAQWPTTINNCGGSSGNRIGIAWGYTLQCDTGSNSWDSTNPFTTGFVHGLYNYIDGSTTWAAGVTHTLPSSFFLSSKPSWWGSLPYPGIGPDITGGTLPAAAVVGEPGGHVYMNPAMNCYYNVLGGTEGGGGGTPFTTYNPEACYAASPVVATPTFSPGAGTYGSTQNVTISTTTIGATICYTTDGSTPTADGAGTCTHGITYSGPVAVSTSLTLQAVGSLSGDSDSAVGSASYIISPVAGVTSFVGGTVVSNGVKIQ